MKTLRMLRFLPAVSLLLFSLPLKAAVILEYTSLSGSAGSPGTTAADLVASGASANPLSWGSGYTLAPTEVGPLTSARGIPVYMAAPSSGSVTAATANADGNYFVFTLSANAANSLSLDSLSFRTASASNGKRGVSVYAIVTGGAQNGQTLVIYDNGTVPTTGEVDADPSVGLKNVSLSALPGLQEIDAVEIRILFHGFGSNPTGKASRDTYLDDVVLTGSVVPEGSSLALLTLGGGCMFLATRRFRRAG